MKIQSAEKRRQKSKNQSLHQKSNNHCRRQKSKNLSNNKKKVEKLKIYFYRGGFREHDFHRFFQRNMGSDKIL